MSVTVVTDSSASLPPEEIRRLGIVVVPLTIVVGGIDYRDGELSLDEVLRRAATEQVSTSSPSPGQFAKAIDDQDGHEGTLVVTVSSEMSATYESAVVAGSYFDDGALEVIDSGTAAGAQGLVVLAAAEAAHAGATLADAADAARRAASNVHLVAMVERLEFLAKSGRVPAAAWAGDSLGVRPMFAFHGGKARPRRPAMSVNAALRRIIEAIGANPAEDATLRVAVLHAQAPDMAHALIGSIDAVHPGADSFVAPFSSVMVAHTGPGLVGAAWWWETFHRSG
jgi:DegV family protein with EDD domain